MDLIDLFIKNFHYLWIVVRFCVYLMQIKRDNVQCSYALITSLKHTINNIDVIIMFYSNKYSKTMSYFIEHGSSYLIVAIVAKNIDSCVNIIDK